MKLEEVLPAYREGKTIISNDEKLYQKERRNGNTLRLAAADENEIIGEWEIAKEKVKKYPALLKSHGRCYVSSYNYRSLEEAIKNHHISMTVVRLITEIPELIQEEEV